MNFHERKKERTEYYERFVKGWKLRPCTACAGSGYYDSHGSPPCGACDGTGKERYKPDIVTCDHCGDDVPIEKAHKTEWKDSGFYWYYCDRCEKGVFGNGKR